MRLSIAILLGVLSFALGFGTHLILANSGVNVSHALGSGGDLAALTQRLDRIEARLEQANASAQGVDDAAIEAQPKNKQAFANAERTIEAARSAGRWTDEDAQSLRQGFSSLSGRQAKELLARLVPAFNSGAIKVVATRPF